MGVRQAATILFPDNLDNLSEKAGKFKLGHGGKFYRGFKQYINFKLSKNESLEKEIDTGLVDEKQESLEDLPAHLKLGKEFTMRVTVLQAYGLASEYSDVFTQFK